jgi:hypothetical protein
VEIASDLGGIKKTGRGGHFWGFRRSGRVAVWLL